MKSVGEIVVELFSFTHFGEIGTLTFDLDVSVKVISTLVIECGLLGCTLIPSMKTVGEIASEI